ncbi:MAG: TfoX/Sxy family protein [Faecalibacterium sp.]|nr:TfoX/Sxy family protein [Ruminococcus sp.]MCM1391845.1 TfoX/Sxy family protein [Ruminococcus sp.]MCM1485709.1 TfoX/Sxy family protein [Faecalibacterium sp.]
MASNIEFVKYVADQIADAGEITYKKMFGEYGIYCDSKIFGVICDNQLFIKITEAGISIAPDMLTGSPYNGAKPHFLIEDVDNGEFLTELVRKTAKQLPLPKPKKNRQKTTK